MSVQVGMQGLEKGQSLFLPPPLATLSAEGSSAMDIETGTKQAHKRKRSLSPTDSSENERVAAAAGNALNSPAPDPSKRKKVSLSLPESLLEASISGEVTFLPEQRFETDKAISQVGRGLFRFVPRNPPEKRGVSALFSFDPLEKAVALDAKKKGVNTLLERLNSYVGSLDVADPNFEERLSEINQQIESLNALLRKKPVIYLAIPLSLAEEALPERFKEQLPLFSRETFSQKIAYPLLQIASNWREALHLYLGEGVSCDYKYVLNAYCNQSQKSPVSSEMLSAFLDRPATQQEILNCNLSRPLDQPLLPSSSLRKLINATLDRHAQTIISLRTLAEFLGMAPDAPADPDLMKKMWNVNLGRALDLEVETDLNGYPFQKGECSPHWQINFAKGADLFDPVTLNQWFNYLGFKNWQAPVPVDCDQYPTNPVVPIKFKINYKLALEKTRGLETPINRAQLRHYLRRDPTDDELKACNMGIAAMRPH